MAFTTDQQTQIIAEANRRAITNGTTVAAEIAKEAQKSGMSMEQAEQNMGYPAGTLGGKQADQGSTNLGMGQQSTSAPLATATRDSIIEQAKSLAAKNGTSAEAELYKYAQTQGKSNADVDTLMGFSPGSTDAWARQNGGQNGVAAPQGNSWTPPAAGAGVAGGGAPGGGAQPIGMGQSPDPQQNLGMGMNPYLRGMGVDIGNQAADVWNRQILPGTRSGAMAAGGFGGSRQGVVESNAMNDLGRNYISGMTNLYGNDWTNQQNRNLQQQGLDQNYDLGLRNNDLGFGQLDANIYQNNFNNSLSAANFGLGVQNYLQGNNQAGINAGTNIQNTAAEYQKYLNNAGNAAGGAGGTRIGTTVS